MQWYIWYKLLLQFEADDKMCRFYSPAYKSRQTDRCYTSLSSLFAPLTTIEWDDVLGQFC